MRPGPGRRWVGQHIGSENAVRGVGVHGVPLTVDQRLLEVVPAAHAGLERDHVGKAHLLHHVSGEYGAVTRTAHDHDRRIAPARQFRDGLLVVPLARLLEHAARDVDRSRNPRQGELRRLADIEHQWRPIASELLAQIPGLNFAHALQRVGKQVGITSHGAIE